MKKSFLALPVATVLIISVFSGCSKEGPKKTDAAAQKASAQQAPQAINVKTATVEAKSVQRSVEATGTLLPWDENIVNSEVPGVVSKIFADLGDRVDEGETLAVLDQKVPKLNLEDAKASHQTNIKSLEKERARFIDAETTLKRYDELFKEGMVSVSQHDTAKTQYDVAAAQVRESEARVEQSAAKHDLAKKRLSDTIIRSPITGEIKKRYITVGQTIEDSTKLFSVVSVGTLKFRGTVAESFVPRIKNGQDVLITVEAFKDKTFKGRLNRISPSVDAETRTLEVEASVPNPKNMLKPGFFSRGMILTKTEDNVPFIPEAAVYSFVGITKVFVIDNGVARERLIKTGLRIGDSVEVIDRIKPGDVVATTNLSNLFDGVKVNVTK